MKTLKLFGPFLLLVFVHTASANPLESAFGAVANAIFFAAWPTATYENFEIFEVNDSEKYITVKMNGKSGFSDGKLTLHLKVFFTDSFGIKDVSVEKHNAILAPPFQTAGLLAKVLEEAAANSNSSSQSTSTSSSCGKRYLSGYEIRVLIEGKTALGATANSTSPSNWKEFQSSSGTAYFQKAGQSYITGHWKIDGDTACWCYGSCETFSCKRVWVTADCDTWLYVDPYESKATGTVAEYISGDTTGQ